MSQPVADAIVAVFVRAEDLREGDVALEPRFSPSNERTEHGFRIAEVRVGRFVDYRLEDGYPDTWRTLARSVEVRLAPQA